MRRSSAPMPRRSASDRQSGPGTSTPRARLPGRSRAATPGSTRRSASTTSCPSAASAQAGSARSTAARRWTSSPRPRRLSCATARAPLRRRGARAMPETLTLRSIPERYNACAILDHNLEAGRARKVAIRWGEDEVTYGELVARTHAFAAALRQVDVHREERVLVVLDEVPDTPVVWCANGELEGTRPLDEVLDEHAGAEVATADTHRDDMAFWLYSSGSTGRPKGVVHLHHDIPYVCATYAREILAIDEDDVTLSTTKLYHAYGMGNNFSFPYSAGASTVLLPGRPRPDLILEAAQRHRPTLFFSVPTVYNKMLNLHDPGSYDLSSVRRCASAAEPLSPTVLRRWRETFGLDILDGIGSTEMLHIYCSNRPDHIVPGTS